MHNFAFAKIGKSIKFLRDNYSAIGGDNEPSCVLRALANHNPDKKFYIIGRSDFSKLSENQCIELFPYDNVIDIWKGYRTPKSSEVGYDYYNYPIQYFEENQIHIDYGIMMIGQIGTVTIPDRTEQVRDRSLIASVIDMTKWYTTPMIQWMNETNVPILEVLNDPRYTLAASRDIIRCPTKSIGQYDYSYTKKHFTSFEDQTVIESKVPVTYAGVETSFCVEYDGLNDITTDRDIPFLVVLNEGKPSRYNFLDEWVLRHQRNVSIYGKWDHEKTVNDPRFLGTIHIDTLQKKLKKVRSTFIIPIAKGWVTSKYIEMIHAGVVPFFHPSYDEQRHLTVPEFFRPKTPEQLMERVQLLADDDDKYRQSIDWLTKKFLTEDKYSGEYLNRQIMTSIDPDYQLVNINDYQKKTISNLDSFFV